MNNIKNLDFDDLIFQSRKLTSSDVIDSNYRKSSTTNSVVQVKYSLNYKFCTCMIYVPRYLYIHIYNINI